MDLDSTKEKEFSISILKKNSNGMYAFKKTIIKPKDGEQKRTNYISYISRANHLITGNSIKRQIKNRRAIFNQAIDKSMKRGLSK
jgi:hypothetical protein